jgi:prepilin-type processing-associated H-X9-DG protein
LAQFSTFWWDSPAVWHENGTCFSFADGHVEYWVWQDAAYLKQIMGRHFRPIRNQADFDRVAQVYWGR